MAVAIRRVLDGVDYEQLLASLRLTQLRADALVVPPGYVFAVTSGMEVVSTSCVVSGELYVYGVLRCRDVTVDGVVSGDGQLIVGL